MQTILNKLKPALNEVHRTAHDQDLIEVPKRAQLDRQAEHSAASQGLPTDTGKPGEPGV